MKTAAQHRITFSDDLMLVLDRDNHGHDAFVVDANEPWLAVAELWSLAGRYDIDAVDALGELRRYLKACR